MDLEVLLLAGIIKPVMGWGLCLCLEMLAELKSFKHWSFMQAGIKIAGRAVL